VDDVKSGMLVKCPACGQRVKVPATEPEPVEEAEPPAAPRRKKKRRSSERLSPEAAEGRQYVIFIGCVLLGLHLVGMIVPMLLLSPVATPTVPLPEYRPTRGKDLSPELTKAMQELDQQLQATRTERTFRSLSWLGSLWMAPGLVLMVVLYVFLYLRHDWARLVMGILLLIFGFLGLVGIVSGGFTFLRSMSVSWAVFFVLYTIASLVVDFAAGFALLKNASIAAYTASR
jgi:hypothetical protein